MSSVSSSALSVLTETLASHFRSVQSERMQGIPILNPVLQVEAVGFEWAPDQEGVLAEGALITPWFMSLVRLPARDTAAARVGGKRIHAFGRERFEFIAADGGPIGSFESCSLFSPMGDFDSQMLARQTAQAVLAELRAPEPAVPSTQVAAIGLSSRRAFMLGRRQS
ncbi:MAG TPA: [NiFe]-hydrogenase assembly, chaperone, HybE [Curvibacter sp.]|jgi:[NiFe] hydrogenase assembly HybE family chaperone|nr:[NiFe]-hydrogenase assembly, chaperone, HybE [Curvibacter sp.]|tara:strand:- start:54 stop:554 length:501 start_codon:yes stop_codon:yes gene_type:complete